MSEMQTALLTLSRLTSGQDKNEHIKMNSFVQNIINNIDMLSYDTQPNVQVEVLHNILGSKRMVEILFTHLIDNACRYGSVEGKQKVVIQSYERESEIIFEINDNGIGIDSSFCEVVFNMFRRLHGQDDYGGGVGAGLTIVRKIIDHKGRVWIKSKLGEGTTVLFSLPKVAHNV